MTAYYNEIDPFAAQWLRNLIAGGHIAPGEVDERSIEDVTPDDLRGFTQCHFFSGIGVWSHSLRLAGWPDDKPVWTGSCPCQPFSAAGKGDGFADVRHLWPAFFHLISECRPEHLLGEQVASGNSNEWFDLVQADLEGMDYAFGLTPFPSSGIGAPHIRERAYWVAHASCEHESAAGDKAGIAARIWGGGLTGWQTPVANDSTGSTHCYSGKNQDGSPKICLKLPGTVILAAWPTPTASDYKGSGKTVIRSDGKDRTFDRLDYAAEQGVIGPLRLTVLARCGLALLSRWKMASS